MLRQSTGLDSRIVTRELQELVQRGLVLQSGRGRWASYALAPTRGRSSRRDRRREILDLLQAKKELRATELAAVIGISAAAVRFWLARMREEKTIEATSSNLRSPTTRYRLKPARKRTR